MGLYQYDHFVNPLPSVLLPRITMLMLFFAPPALEARSVIYPAPLFSADQSAYSFTGVTSVKQLHKVTVPSPTYPLLYNRDQFPRMNLGGSWNSPDLYTPILRWVGSFRCSEIMRKILHKTRINFPWPRRSYSVFVERS